MFKKINNKGFTIVETLIVLAIAATIVAVVLLSVPGLQNSSRNTQLKTAANDVLADISTFTSNNNGTGPNCEYIANGVLTLSIESSATNAVGGGGSSTLCTASSKQTFNIPAQVTAGQVAATSTSSSKTLFVGLGSCPVSTSTTQNLSAYTWYVGYYPNGGSVQCNQI